VYTLFGPLSPPPLLHFQAETVPPSCLILLKI
jgi:hypothetical protein